MLFADYCKMMDDSPVEELIIRGLRNQESKVRHLAECFGVTKDEAKAAYRMLGYDVDSRAELSPEPGRRKMPGDILPV
jgi:hypothetical protein